MTALRGLSGRLPSSGQARHLSRDTTALAVLFTASGIGHFVKPKPFESIVPKPLPNKRKLVYLSGALELVCAALLLNPKTRKVGGLASAALLVGVLPANVQLALSAMRNSKTTVWFTFGTVARIPLQSPMIRTALRAAKS